MIVIPDNIWDYEAAYDAADGVEVEIDIRPLFAGMGVYVYDPQKTRRWVDEYVSLCIHKINGESSRVLMDAGMEV